MTKSICRTHLMILSLALVATLNAQAEQYPKCTSPADCEASIAQDQKTLATNQAAQFVAVYVDSSSNLSWSKALPGTYSNGCVDANDNYDSSKCSFVMGPDGSRQVNVDDSKAAKACRDIGGRLPTKPEIESLMRDFDHSESSYGPKLSESGVAAMQAKFGDSMNNRFWSSSVFSNDSDSPFDIAVALYGGVGYYSRDNRFSVRCVVGR